MIAMEPDYNAAFGFEAWNTEKVHVIEDLLSELGFIL